jgi:hypothetical protein
MVCYFGDCLALPTDVFAFARLDDRSDDSIALSHARVALFFCLYDFRTSFQVSSSMCLCCPKGKLGLMFVDLGSGSRFPSNNGDRMMGSTCKARARHLLRFAFVMVGMVGMVGLDWIGLDWIGWSVFGR